MRSATGSRRPATARAVASAGPVHQASAGAACALFAVAAVFHLGVVLLVHWQTDGRILFPDAGGYDSASTTIATAWRGGGSLHPSDLAWWSGSALWGYPAVMALCKVMTGGGWLAAKSVLALLAATGAAAAYGLGVATGRGHRRAVLVGLVVGISPTLLLWDAWGLKDGLITSFALWSLLLQTRARFSFACIGTLLSIQACLYVRPATALFLAVALLARVRCRRGYLVGSLIVVAAAAIVIIPRATVLLDLMDNLEVKDGTALGFTGGYGPKSLLSHPQYLVTFLLGPFPWAFGPGTAVPERWLYLGTMVWIACLALAPAALRKAWADTAGIGRAAILASSAYAATYFATFGAEYYRQRSLLECMMIILILLYLPLSPVAAMTRVHVWLAVVAGVAILQSPDLTPTVRTKALAACAMALAVALLLMPDVLRALAQRFRARRILRL